MTNSPPLIPYRPIEHKLWRCEHDFNQTSTPAKRLIQRGLSSFTESFVTLSKSTLNSKNSLSVPIVLQLHRNGGLVHVVMNAFNRVVDVHGEFFGHLNVFLRPYIRKMAAYKGVELIGKDLIEHFQVLMEIRREIKSLKRCIAGGYASQRPLKIWLRERR